MPFCWRFLWLAPLIIVFGCTETVVSGLSESEANRIVGTIQRGGVAAEKILDSSDGRFRIEVGKADFAPALRLLNDHELPKERRPGLLESIGDDALVPSRSSEHARFLAGTAAELEKTLSQVDGVLTARVHLGAPRKNRLEPAEPAPRPTASVLLRHRTRTLAMPEVDVRRLVSGAVPGLALEDVTVIAVAEKTQDTLPDVARLGPITTTRHSANLLRMGLAGVALTNVALAVAVFALLARARRERAAANDALRGAGS